MKICQFGTELFHADGWTDMKLIVAFRSFTNTPESLQTSDVSAFLVFTPVPYEHK